MTDERDLWRVVFDDLDAALKVVAAAAHYYDTATSRRPITVDRQAFDALGAALATYRARMEVARRDFRTGW